MKKLIFILVCNLWCFNVASSEITQNEAFCGVISAAKIDTINLMCNNVPTNKIIKDLKVKYYSISNYIENTVTNTSKAYDKQLCIRNQEALFKFFYEGCYSTTTSLSGK